MQQNKHRQKYPDNWDCSRRKKHYTSKEIIFIHQSYKNGKSIKQIAQKVYRGEYGIEVVIMRRRVGNKQQRQIKNNVSQSFYQHKAKKNNVPQSFYQHTPKQNNVSQPVYQHKPKQYQRKPVQPRRNGIKYSATINRKFSAGQVVVKSTAKETQEHIYQMMGL